MANWLLQQEEKFDNQRSYALEYAGRVETFSGGRGRRYGGGAGGAVGDDSVETHGTGISHLEPGIVKEATIPLEESEQEYYVLLRKVLITDIKKIFGSSEDVIFYSVVVNGTHDMKSKDPFWARQFSFPDVKSGTTLSIDEEQGEVLFTGKPMGFLNIYLFAVKDKATTREFAGKLKESFLAKGLGDVAAGAATIFSGPAAPVAAPLARDAVTVAVNTALTFFEQKKDKVIGTYYGSLLPKKYGAGFHPKGYPDKLLDCGGSMRLAYQVKSIKSAKKSRTS